MTNSYPALPLPDTAEGAPRRTGVEIEFAGMDERQAARCIAELLGGEITESDSRELTVLGTELGDIEVELDTVLRKKKGVPLLEKGLDLATGLVPVEIIAPPLPTDRLARMDDLVAALRERGATGTRDGLLLGFGVHLNTEVVAPDHPHTLKTILAFGLIEPWLRREEDLDMTRRLMPYVNQWPSSFVDDMARDMPGTLAALMAVAARHIDSRNHGLDLFPLFAHAEPELYQSLFPKPDKTSARPTFHFRMPDCRIDEPDWSLARSWRLWSTVEEVAQNADLLEALGRDWLDHMHFAPGADGRWASKVDARFKTHWQEAAE